MDSGQAAVSCCRSTRTCVLGAGHARLPLLYVKAPSAGPAWHGNKATLNQQIILLPPRKWTSQQSNSPSAIPSIRFSWLMQCESKEWFSKMLGWTRTLPLPHRRWTEGLFSQLWRTPEFQAVSWYPVKAVLTWWRAMPLPKRCFILPILSSLRRGSS